MTMVGNPDGILLSATPVTWPARLQLTHLVEEILGPLADRRLDGVNQPSKKWDCSLGRLRRLALMVWSPARRSNAR
jgi:hypothetical protein